MATTTLPFEQLESALTSRRTSIMATTTLPFEQLESALTSRRTSILTPDSESEVKGSDCSCDEKKVVTIFWQPEDVRHPFHWPMRKKLPATIIAFLFNACTAINATGYNAGQYQGADDLGVSSLDWLTGTTSYIVPVAIAPLVLAPLSEVYGRRPLYCIAFAIFALMFIPQALAPNLACILVSRIIQGIAGSVGNTMVAGSVADMYPKAKRAIPMGAFVLTVFFGQAIGSTASIYTVTNIGWRWMFWWQGALALLAAIVVFLFTPESREGVILSKIARQMTKESQYGTKFKTAHDDKKISVVKVASRNLTRPIAFFFTEPIICFLALWIGFLWGVVFMTLNGVSVAFAVYGWSISQRQTVLMTIALGALIGFLTNLHQAKLYGNACKKAPNGLPAPEARLYWSMVATFLTSCGLICYAWGAQRHVHPVVPIIGLTLFSWGTYVIYLATLNYIADAYETYASSGVACQALLRNIFAGTFILFARSMYVELTPPIASTVLACTAAALGTAPFVLFFYGRRLRQVSKVCKQLRREEEAKAALQ